MKMHSGPYPFGWCSQCGYRVCHSMGADLMDHTCIPNKYRVHEAEGAAGARCSCGLQEILSTWLPADEAGDMARLRNEMIQSEWPVF